MGMFGDAGQAVDDFFGDLFTSEPQEWERAGYENYESWWEDQKPDILRFQSPIYPGGFDRQGYEEAYYDWMSQRPNQSGSGE